MSVLSGSLPFPQSSINGEDAADDAVMLHDEEQGWIAASRADPQAFAPLYDRYATPIYRFCYRKVGDPDIANDLTAQIFIRAIERIDRYEPRKGASFRSWLFAIARNMVTDRWRRLRPTTPLDPARHILHDDDPGPEARAVHGDELDRLLAVLTQIPSNQREIIELRLAGLTTVEVGEVLGMTKPAVKAAQSRAYKRLRELLSPSEGATS